MNIVKLINWSIFFLIVVILCLMWENKHLKKNDSDIKKDNIIINNSGINPNLKSYKNPGTIDKMRKDRLIVVNTDCLSILIDSIGGDIISVHLKNFKRNPKYQNKGYILIDSIHTRFLVAQFGFLNNSGPDSNYFGRVKYSVANKFHDIKNTNISHIDLKYTNINDVSIIKRFILKKGFYDLKIKYLINNFGIKTYCGNLYARLKKQNLNKNDNFLLSSSKTYSGCAVKTINAKYKKLLFNDKFYKFKNIIMGGWVAIIDKNFILSIAPQINHIHQFCGERFKNNMFGIRFIDTVVLCADPGKIFDVELQLFIGPKISEILKSFVSGLELSIDYGILWPLSQPVFILLQYIYSFIHNWGWSIIIITVFIKLFFLRLSAGSYRSMSKMKKLQPIIDDMKIKYGGDKHNFGIMLMKMYKKEQVNPIVGCLPIIIQIPVFISFYYVILESIELRHSPFVFWIYDLSAKDPYYILPILMGMTMFVQQKISPSPSEYMQKKIMAILPFIFTLFFLNFPSGLVIYWIVNNLLSISQQYYIMNNLK